MVCSNPCLWLPHFKQLCLKRSRLRDVLKHLSKSQIYQFYQALPAIVYPKMKTMLSFTHPWVVLNLYDWLSHVEHNSYFKKHFGCSTEESHTWWGSVNCIFLVNYHLKNVFTFLTQVPCYKSHSMQNVVAGWIFVCLVAQKSHTSLSMQTEQRNKHLNMQIKQNC